MRLLIIGLLLLTAPARASDESLEDDYHPRDFNKTNKADGDWSGYKTGDHFQWTEYGQYYNKADYGHVYEWSKPGFSKMSICWEVDGETHGRRYHELADDAHCPTFETEYQWDIPVEGAASRCLKVDKTTHGQRFSRIVDLRMCRKPATVYAWEGKNCSEVDQDTQGRVYRAAAPDYLCARVLDIAVAYGRKEPVPLRPLPPAKPASLAGPRSAGRAPASVAMPLELDPAFREEPDELEDGVDHVHRSADKIHHR